MKRIMNLVVQERFVLREPNQFVVSFEIRDDVAAPEKTLREAVTEFVLSGTDEANKALASANGAFNWADAINAVPKDLFIKHGLTPIEQQTIDVFVDHNEILTRYKSDSHLFVEVRNFIKNNIAKTKEAIAFWSNAENPAAEKIAEELTARDNKLCSLMAVIDINEQVINALIESEEDEDLVAIYKDILDILQS